MVWDQFQNDLHKHHLNNPFQDLIRHRNEKKGMKLTEIFFITFSQNFFTPNIKNSKMKNELVNGYDIVPK